MRRVSGVFDTSYLQDMTVFRTNHYIAGMVILILLFLVLPAFVSDFWLAFISSTAVTIIALQGLNILAGYCGQLSIGHTAFMAVGAYTSTILARELGLSLWVCMPVGGLGAALVGLLFGLPSLRVKGYYLAITTIAAQFLIIYMIKTPFQGVTGGAIPLSVPELRVGSFVFNSEIHFYYLIMAIMALMTFLSKSLTRSYFGRALVAVRDNDIAAEAMGINIFKYKLMAFFIGCFFAGIAGSVWAVYVRVISPDDFTLVNSIWQMGMLIIGGLGSTLGPFFGAVFISALREICVIIGPWITSMFPQIGAQVSASLVEMTFGVAIVLFLVYEPRGLSHRWEILKESYRLWPFSY